jgi:hypothetical protein
MKLDTAEYTKMTCRFPKYILDKIEQSALKNRRRVNNEILFILDRHFANAETHKEPEPVRAVPCGASPYVYQFPAQLAAGRG